MVANSAGNHRAALILYQPQWVAVSARENIQIDDVEEARHSLKVWEWYNQNSREYAMHVPVTVMSELRDARPVSYYYENCNNFVCDTLCTITRGVSRI